MERLQEAWTLDPELWASAILFARLLESLSSRTETDGQSLLHHCAVLYCGVTPDGSHNGHDLPWVVAGQAGGSLRTGQFLELDRWTHPDFKDGRRDVGRGHNDLLLTLAQAVGTPLEVIGNPKACQGPIREMLV